MSDHQKCYVCLHVFEGERPVLLVSRDDGDWSLVCGEEHASEASQFRVVGLDHVLEADPTLNAILDLPAEWEAERECVGDTWVRQCLQDREFGFQRTHGTNSRVLKH